jgi:hypothetical protein
VLPPWTSGAWSSHKTGSQLPLVGLSLTKVKSAAILFSSTLTIGFFGLCPSELITKLLTLWTIDRTSWTVDQPDARPLHKQDNTNTEQTQTFIPRVGFEHTIPVLKRCLIPRSHCDRSILFYFNLFKKCRQGTGVSVGLFESCFEY